MPFDLTTWKAQLSERLTNWRTRLNASGANSAYYFLAASTFLPVVQAYQQGNLEPLLLVPLVSGIGANLLSNIVQNWRDEATAAAQLQNAAAQDGELRANLDSLLTQLDALPLADRALAEADRAWFAEAIRNELHSLGSAIRYQATVTGGGAVAQGDGAMAAGEGATIITGNIDGDYLGPGATKNTVPDPRQIEAEQREKARRTYLDKLRRHCQVLPLATLGGEGGVEEELSLDKVYIDLNTGIYILRKDLNAICQGEKVNLTSASIAKESPELLTRTDEKKDVVPLPVLEAVMCTPRTVLLGDPGAGKSTFAHKLLGMQAAVQLGECPPITGIAANLLPVMIVLRELTPALGKLRLESLSTEAQKRGLLQTVKDHLAAELTRLNAASFIPGLDTAMENGDVLLVLDGLDEVPQALRQCVRQVVSALLAEYHLKRLIITCRIRPYTAETAFPLLQTFTLRSFDEEQIKNFVTAWYNAQVESGHVRPSDRDERIRDLLQAALSADLRQIASNPMMLTSMAIIHQKEIGLPRERVRLYKLVVDVLIRRWQKHKSGESNMAPSEALVEFLKDENRLLATLERLAYEAHQAGKGKKEAADLPRKDALVLLDAKEYLGSLSLVEEFLDYIDQRAGLLKGNGGELEKPTSYSFPHRIFQEYLAGCYLVRERSAARQVHTCAAEGDFWSLAAQLGAEELVYNRRSLHIMLDMAYQLCASPQPQGDQAQRAALWSGNMACLAGLAEIEKDADSPNGGKAYLERLRTALLAVMAGELPAIERVEAGRTLAKMGDPRLEVMSVARMEFLHIPAGEFLMGSPESETGSKDREYPQHKIALSEFWLTRYPITNAQYAEFVQAGGYKNPVYWAEAGAGRVAVWVIDKLCLGRVAYQAKHGPDNYGEPFNLPNHPVVGISWYEALAFCHWLTECFQQGHIACNAQIATGIVTKALTVTLPSEAEWEYAASGKTHRVYPWGMNPDLNLANVSETRIGSTNAVGCFSSRLSPFGFQEMSGNVQEWTRSLWGKNPKEPEFRYPYSPNDGRENTLADCDTCRVLRGSSVDFSIENARCSARLMMDPVYGYRGIGFRVSVSPLPMASEDSGSLKV